MCFGIAGLIFAIATFDTLAQQNQTSATIAPDTEITCLTAAIVFDALKNRPKPTARIRKEAATAAK